MNAAYPLHPDMYATVIGYARCTTDTADLISPAPDLCQGSKTRSSLLDHASTAVIGRGGRSPESVDRRKRVAGKVVDGRRGSAVAIRFVAQDSRCNEHGTGDKIAEIRSSHPGAVTPSGDLVGAPSSGITGLTGVDRVLPGGIPADVSVPVRRVGVGIRRPEAGASSALSAPRLDPALC